MDYAYLTTHLCLFLIVLSFDWIRSILKEWGPVGRRGWWLSTIQIYYMLPINYFVIGHSTGSNCETCLLSTLTTSRNCSSLLLNKMIDQVLTGGWKMILNCLWKFSTFHIKLHRRRERVAILTKFITFMFNMYKLHCIVFEKIPWKTKQEESIRYETHQDHKIGKIFASVTKNMLKLSWKGTKKHGTNLMYSVCDLYDAQRGFWSTVNSVKSQSLRQDISINWSN